MKSSPVCDSDGDYHSRTVEVRKAENGFIRRESVSGPNGYSSKETIHKTHPGLEPKAPRGAEEHRVGSAMMKAAKGHLSRKK